MTIDYKKKIVHHHFTGFLIRDYITENDIKLYIIVNGKELVFYVDKITKVSPTVEKYNVNRVLYNKDFPTSVLSMLKLLDLLNTPMVLYLVKDRDTYTFSNKLNENNILEPKYTCEGDGCIEYLKNSFFTTIFTLSKV